MQYLYIIKCQDFFKIGVANDVENRLSQLSTGNPFPLVVEVTYAFDNAEVVERALHQRFKEQRTRGEWFELSYEDQKTIHSICLSLGGSAYEYTGKKANNKTIAEAEEMIEAFVDSPNFRIEKRTDGNGEIRGFAIRERNKNRELVKYVGKNTDSLEFEKILQSITTVTDGRK